MSDVLTQADQWAAAGKRVALATVVDTRKSAPLPPGSKMAISSTGDVVGAVSGGCVEGAVVEVAEEIIGGADPRLLHFGIADSDAWEAGLPCGGVVGEFVERYES